MRRLICVLMVLLPFLVLPALGAELSFPQVDELLREAEGYGVTETDGLGQGVQSILETGLDQAGSLLRHSFQTGLKLLAVVLLCGLAESAALDGKAGGLKAVEVAGALAVTALTVSDMNAMIGLGRETIQQMDAFAGLLLPAMATLTAATGGVTGAAVRQGVTVLMITHDMHLMLEYTPRALVFSDGRLIADRSAAGVLCDPALIERAALKETSLFTLANRCGIAPPEAFVQRFIDFDREVREHGC